MNVQILSHANAFNPGSEIWFMAELEESNWAKKINWYLNFQASNIRHHQKQTMSEHLVSILNQTEIPPSKIKDFDNQLVIPSEHLLPNKYCIIKKWNDPKTWFQEIKAQHSKMNKPSIRIFLPQEVSPQEANTIIAKLFEEGDLTIVADLPNESSSR